MKVVVLALLLFIHVALLALGIVVYIAATYTRNVACALNEVETRTVRHPGGGVSFVYQVKRGAANGGAELNL